MTGDEEFRPLGGNDSHGKCQSSLRRTCSTSTAYWLALIFGLVSAGLLAALIGVVVKDEEASSSTSTCKGYMAEGNNGMVSTTNTLATQAGLTILKMGGNAVDAFLAVNFMLSLTQPQSTGIGGGLFLMIYNASTDSVLALDGREEAPARFNATSFCANTSCIDDANCGCNNGAYPFRWIETGGHPVGVPGAISAMLRAYDELGSGAVSLADIVQPTIDAARNGFPMYTMLFNAITNNIDRLTLFNASAKLYLPNNGLPTPVGELFFNPDYADTLELLVQEGVDLFYTGQIAEEIVNCTKAAIEPNTNLTGVMELPDLAGYKAVYRQPVNFTYRGYTIYSMNMPSSGGASIGNMLNQLENYDITSYGHMTTEFLQKFLDSQDIAFADRLMYMADADYVDVPVAGIMDKGYALSRAQTASVVLKSARVALNGTTVAPGVPPGADTFSSVYSLGQAQEEHGTTHIAISDKWGNLVSSTTTIEDIMGSAVVLPGRGVLLNNELTDFQQTPINPATGLPYANAPAGGKMPRRTALGSDSTTMGGKRPLSSMTPLLIFDPQGRPFMSIGSPGGSRIIGAVLNGVVNYIDFDMCLADAVNAPRAISRNSGQAELEAPVCNDTTVVNTLTTRQFNLTQGTYLGYLEAVQINYKSTNSSDRTTVSPRYYGVTDITRVPSASVEGY